MINPSPPIPKWRRKVVSEGDGLQPGRPPAIATTLNCSRCRQPAASGEFERRPSAFFTFLLLLERHDMFAANQGRRNSRASAE